MWAEQYEEARTIKKCWCLEWIKLRILWVKFSNERKKKWKREGK